MSSFSQWFVSYQKNQAVKRISWICGTERVLVDDIVETIVSHFSDQPWARSYFIVGDDKERDIWADLDSYPLDGRTPRIVVVRNAEKLKHLDRVASILGSKNVNTSVVFVSNEPALARLEPTPEQKAERKQPDLVPHLAAIQGRGALVECKPFTQATAKHAVTWVCSKVEIRRGVAAKLLDRANGDLRLTRDAYRKLSVFPDEISEQTINLLLSARPRLSFVDALLEIDKPAALLALQYMDPSEYSAAIGLLDQRLDVIGTVRDMLVTHKTPGQISAALGTMGFLTKELTPLAKSYDPRRRHQLRAMLTKTDEALRAGVVKGPIESLVAYW